MPTYEYACTDCGSDLEAVQSFSEPSLSECPTCGGKLRKRFGAVGVVFKGSGFYRNDSRTDARGGSSERKSDGEDKPAAADKPGKTETKSEPAAAAAAKSNGDSKSSSSKSESSNGSGNSASSPKASTAA